MVNKFFIYVSFFCLIHFNGNAQKDFQPDKYRNAHVENDVSASQFRISVNKVRTTTHKYYYWYDNKAVHETQGAYSGYVLDGDYKEFSYPTNNLVKKGSFRKGLKHGNWIEWNKDGTIKETSTWKKGILNGNKSYYNDSGAIKKTEKYHNGICKSCIPKKKQSFNERLHRFLSKYNISGKK